MISLNHEEKYLLGKLISIIKVYALVGIMKKRYLKQLYRCLINVAIEDLHLS